MFLATDFLCYSLLRIPLVKLHTSYYHKY